MRTILNYYRNYSTEKPPIKGKQTQQQQHQQQKELCDKWQIKESREKRVIKF